MKNFIELNELLSAKRDLFVQYEAQTDAIMVADDENISHYITKRDELAIAIDEQSDKINLIISKDETGRLKSISDCSVQYSSLAAQEIKSYETAKEIYSLINRIKDKNDAIVREMNEKREALRERIVETQNTPKIAKYLNALGNAPEGGTYTGEFKKI